MASLLINNGTVVTMNDDREIVAGGVAIRDGRIIAVGAGAEAALPTPDRTVDATGDLIVPGFVQTHVHLCQTLFRSFADDRPLLEWLRQRVWPMEAAHTPRSLRAAARLAGAELLLSGTTSVLTMETVHDTDAVVEAVAALGLRATIGKCMMDRPADGVPARLTESTRDALDESLALHARWHGAEDGRVRIALAPRFAVSCTRQLLEEVAAEATRRDMLVHTHASENRDEVELVREQSGLANMEYLAAVGLTTERLCAAHCVWVDESERRLMAERQVKVLHCPGSNLKLGSGLAPIVELRALGVEVSLGADGGACNNRLDMFDEMRLAATLQAVRRGPGALMARDALWMATRSGAATLGLGTEIGSLEVGKRGDVIVVSTSRPHTTPANDPYSTLVYAARGSDVRTVVVDGRMLVDEFALVSEDATDIVRTARSEAAALAARAQI